MAVQLQQDIINLARTLGWKVAHFTAVKTEHGWRVPVAADGKGFPDLVLVRERVVVAEIKEGGHKPRPEQAAWLAAFKIAGVEAWVWTRQDWDSELVVKVLRKGWTRTFVDHRAA